MYIWRKLIEFLNPENKVNRILNITLMLGFILFYFAFAYAITMEHSDDIFFGKTTLNFDWLKERYYNWSSRTIIESITVILCKYPMFFRISMPFILIAMPILLLLLLRFEYSPKYIAKYFPLRNLKDYLRLNQEDSVESLQEAKKLSAFTPQVELGNSINNLWLYFAVCFCYPLRNMSSAGWIATFTNYYFIVLAIIGSLLLMIDNRHTEKIRNIVKNILLFALLLYACNHEQGSLIMAIMCAFLWLIGVRNKKILGAFIICIISLIFIATAPGNGARYTQEIKIWWPEFGSFSILYKFYLGYIVTLYYYIFTPNVITVLFISVLCSVAFKMRLLWAILFPLLLFSLQIIYAIYVPYKYQYAPNELYYFDSLWGMKLSAIAFLILSILFAIGVIWLLKRVFVKNRQLYFTLFLLSIALISRLILSISPTLFASGARTYIYSDFILFFIVLYILKIKETNNLGLVYKILPIAALNFVSILAAIFDWYV